jgi:potassium efflux system protein
MPRPRNTRYFSILLIACLFYNGIVYSQPKVQKDSAQQNPGAQLPDSVQAKLNITDTSATLLPQKIEDVIKIISLANNILDRGFDTAGIAEELPALEDLVNYYNVSVSSKEGLVNLRSIKTMKSFLLQDQVKLEKWQSTLHGYSKEMVNISSSLNSIIKDSVLRNMLEDSTLRSLYLKQILALRVRWKAADSSNKINLQKIVNLQSRVATAYILVNGTLDEILYLEKNFQRLMWSPEEPGVWNINAENYKVSLWEMTTSSFASIQKVILNFFRISISNPLLSILLILGIYAWVFINLKRIKQNHEHPESVLQNAPNITRHPFWYTFLLVFTALPLTYSDPPPGYIVAMWVITGVIYTALRYTQWSQGVRKYWIIFLIIFLAASYGNILMRPTYGERWLQFALTIAALISSFILLRNFKKHQSELPKYTKPLVILFMLLMAASLIANIVGCFALSKYFTSSAVYSVLSAQVLFCFVQVTVEAFYLQYEAGKKSSRIIAYFEFKKIKDRLLKFLYLVAGIAWLFILSRNLNFYDVVYDWLADFLNTQRKIGQVSFSFGSIFIFIMVIWLSSFISKLIVTLFDTASEKSSGIKKTKWSSFILLGRLAILGGGMLLAFAASGIPLDKLTIIIGALGVGIGFGLQNIVNNLVSGIILAFERPIQVGDAIEVGTRFGTVKEIGIRASKLTTADGSEVIVPNGDLLSQHIVNWTLSSHYRRVEIIIGVDYSTSLHEVTSIVKDILCTQRGIESSPTPLVLVHNFNTSSVDLRLLFWSNIDTWFLVKSEVMIKIFDAFKEHNINIPFPQQDVHIKSIDGNIVAKESNADGNEPADRLIKSKS